MGLSFQLEVHQEDLYASRAPGAFKTALFYQAYTWCLIAYNFTCLEMPQAPLRERELSQERRKQATCAVEKSCISQTGTLWDTMRHDHVQAKHDAEDAGLI